MPPSRHVSILSKRRVEERVSILGFGAMRLPILDGDSTKIDEEHAIRMIRHAIDEGVNYVDTAFPYHGNDFTRPGMSEPLVGKALQDGYREKVFIATKLPTWILESRQQMMDILDGQLERLRTKCIDFYLVHNINKNTWPKAQDLGVIEFLEEAKAAGKIKHIGFSYHDSPQYFPEVVDTYDWEFCQIQYNYLDESFQAGRSGLDYAASKDLGIIIMEPLRGGSLTKDLPDDVHAIFDEATERKSPAQWALRWLWNQEKVGTVLSGMSNMEQTLENVASANAENACTFSEDDATLMKRAQDAFQGRMKVDCTACRYCMPCPQGIDIPECFALYNKFHMTGGIQSKMFYHMNFKEGQKASDCVECGKCEGHCPQNIEIMKELKDVARDFETPPEKAKG